MRHEESRIQQCCVRWFRYQYPEAARLLFAVPNGYWTTASQASRAKAEGMLSGVSDLLLLVAAQGFHGLAIEMKTKRGRQTSTQRAWQDDAEDAGWRYVVCRSLDEFVATVTEWMNLKN